MQRHADFVPTDFLHMVLACHPLAVAGLMLTATAAFSIIVAAHGALGFDGIAVRRAGVFGGLHALFSPILNAGFMVLGRRPLPLRDFEIIFASQLGFAVGTCTILGRTSRQEVYTESSAVVSLSGLVSIALYSLIPDQDRHFWKFRPTNFHSIGWKSWSFFAGACIGASATLLYAYAVRLGVLTLRVGSWKNGPIPPWDSEYCKIHWKALRCIANDRDDILFLCTVFPLLGAVVGREAVRVHNAKAVASQTRDPQHRYLAVAYGEDVMNEAVRQGPLQGHKCLTHNEIFEMRRRKSLRYAEIAPIGLQTLLETDVLQFDNVRTIVDLGMGVGKLVLQLFLRYQGLNTVIGIEEVPSRYRAAKVAAANLASQYPDQFEVRVQSSGAETRIIDLRGGPVVQSSDAHHKTTRGEPRELILQRGDYRHCGADWIAMADICLLNVFPGGDAGLQVAQLLSLVKPGTRIVSLTRLTSYLKDDRTLKCHGTTQSIFTSWGNDHGHRFFVYEAVHI